MNVTNLPRPATNFRGLVLAGEAGKAERLLVLQLREISRTTIDHAQHAQPDGLRVQLGDRNPPRRRRHGLDAVKHALADEIAYGVVGEGEAPRRLVDADHLGPCDVWLEGGDAKPFAQLTRALRGPRRRPLAVHSVHGGRHLAIGELPAHLPHDVDGARTALLRGAPRAHA